MFRRLGKRAWFGCIGLTAAFSTVAYGQIPEYTFDVWGRTSYGDGYVYGPPYRSTGMAVVDFDVDDDFDFVLPSLSGPPQVMRNLGNNRAFYPGGPRELDLPDPVADWYHGRYMDFADVTGDGLPDAVVVANNFDTDKSAIFWYENEGPREAPQFSAVTTPVYTSPQDGLALGAVDVTDLDGDNLFDITFVEFTMVPPSDPPRVYFMRNTGTATHPQWDDPQDLTRLSSFMPDPRVAEKSEIKSQNPWLHPKVRASLGKKMAHKATTYVDTVTDMEFGDWDGDDDLDFMFYDSEVGVHWVPCVDDGLAPAQDARWENAIDVDVIPYTQSDFFDHVQGAFAVRPAAGVSPYPDFYVAVEGMLLTWRYNTRDQVYEIAQQNAVAHDSGTSNPAFWDCDNDGDLDLFRVEAGDLTGRLVYIQNLGTPYSAIWDYALPLDDVQLWLGTAQNNFRQDLHTFADGDGDGYMELFVQDQGARIHCYYADSPVPPATLPTFTYAGEISTLLGPVVPPGSAGIQPRGIALGDFNGSEDGVKEIITAFDTTSSGTHLVYLAQDYVEGTYPTSNWKAPYDLVLYDWDGQELFRPLIENVAASDVDRDGRTDLVLTLSEDMNYAVCTFHVWRNVLNTQTNTFHFEYAGEITGPQDADPFWARLTAFADIDTDGDDDLFIGHQFIDPDEPNPEFNRYPYLHFYRNGSDTGLGYWQTRVVAGQSWTFSVGNQQASFDYIFNGSGGSIVDDVYTAGDTGRTVDIIQTTNTDPNYRIFIDVLPTVGVESKAIFVVGGAADDPLYPAFTQLVKNAYDALLLQGIDEANILLYASNNIDADGDGDNDRDGAPSLATLQSVITTWALDANRLLVYFIDHGQRDRFRINAVDYLDAASYAQWVNQLQTARPALAVTTVLDMCEAGSFVDDLEIPATMKKAAVQRTTIASSGEGPTEGVALFDPARSVSFSLSFWEEIWNGSSYGEAFSTAKVAIESINPLQVPQLDDNGNGIPNEAGDGLLAEVSRPGADFDRPAPGVYIGEVAPPQVLTTNTATLWLSDVVAGFPVEAAGALIVPPNLERSIGAGDDEQPLSGLVWVDFTYNESLDRWEAPYGGFDTGGLYRIQYYVSTLGRWHASPRIGFVDRVGIPDAFENDNTRDVAPWIPLNFVQGHNFHQQGDVDWMWLTSPNGGTCTIAALAQGPNCQPIVQLFKAHDLELDPSAAPVATVTAPGPGRDVVFDHSFEKSEQYLLRVTNNAASGNGEGTSYFVVVAAGSGGIIPPVVIVIVREQGTATPLSNASVKAVGGVNTFNGKTTSTGQADFVCTFGDTYTFEADKAGYKKSTRSVRVNNQTETVQINLVPEATATATLQLTAAGDAQPKLTFGGVEFDMPQTFTLPVGAEYNFGVPLQLSGGLYWDKWSDGSTAATRKLTLGANATLEARYKLTPRTDVSADNELDAFDVQVVINGALGLSTGGLDADASGDGLINALDVQLVINAVLTRIP